jgi:hypothetical protein
MSDLWVDLCPAHANVCPYILLDVTVPFLAAGCLIYGLLFHPTQAAPFIFVVEIGPVYGNTPIEVPR